MASEMNEHTIEEYLSQLATDELAFKRGATAAPLRDGGRPATLSSRLLDHLSLLARSLFDYLCLQARLLTRRGSSTECRFVYTAPNFCTRVDGSLEDRILTFLTKDDVVYLNYAKQCTMQRISGRPVYNLGGLVKLLSKVIYRNRSELMSIFLAYRLVNDSVLGRLHGNEVYTLCYYDLNGLSLMFSKHRAQFRLIEAQHGSIVGYPPYAQPAPVKCADTYYVKNAETADYLSSHLCQGHSCEYRVIPYPEAARGFRPGLNILYASTVETNGFHQVFSRFLREYKGRDLNLRVRLHPRERDKQGVFEAQLEELGIAAEFDSSQNWLEGAHVANLVVVSPWSSTLEEACDNGFLSITIDPVGSERFHHLIDEGLCFFSEDLVETVMSLRANGRLEAEERPVERPRC